MGPEIEAKELRNNLCNFNVLVDFWGALGRNRWCARGAVKRPGGDFFGVWWVEASVVTLYRFSSNGTALPPVAPKGLYSLEDSIS